MFQSIQAAEDSGLRHSSLASPADGLEYVMSRSMARSQIRRDLQCHLEQPETGSCKRQPPGHREPATIKPAPEKGPTEGGDVVGSNKADEDPWGRDHSAEFDERTEQGLGVWIRSRQSFKSGPAGRDLALDSGSFLFSLNIIPSSHHNQSAADTYCEYVLDVGMQLRSHQRARRTNLWRLRNLQQDFWSPHRPQLNP